VPLYVEEMTKALLESGHLKEHDAGYELTQPLDTISIPATLQDSLMARLDNLSTAKGVAQLGSVIGRTFPYDLLHAVSPLSETSLQGELGKLVDAGLIYQRGIAANRTYIFKHALVQDIAYESLLRRTRQEHHRRIAKVVEEQFSEIAENQPELLAYHYMEAGLNQESAIYWYQAGKRAIERSAHTEAITHFNQGLELLNTLPEALERNQQELEILVSLGPALIVLKGYGAPEVGRAYARAQEICQQLGDNPQTFQALWGLRAFYYLRAELQRALELGGQLLRLAQRHDNFGYLLEAHRSLGTTSFNMGELQSAHHHLRQVIDLYDPQHHHAHTSLYGQDPGMVSLTYMAMTLWILGYPVQALQKSSEALDLHQQISHSYSLVFILTSIARLHQFCREGVLVQERIEISLALCSEHGFGQFLAQGKILRGWGLAMKGEFEDGINQIEEGLSAYRATGGALTVPYWLALLADAYGRKGQPEVALDQLGEGLTVLDKTGERFYESEIHRLKGSLLLQQSPDNAAEAESCFQQAISIAQNQSAKSWELRAATSLAKLWQSQGKRQKAYDLLAPVYGWFTEGFDTADLIDAKALLDELA
jgi:predicted ATPase